MQQENSPLTGKVKTYEFKVDEDFQFEIDEAISQMKQIEIEKTLLQEQFNSLHNKFIGLDSKISGIGRSYARVKGFATKESLVVLGQDGKHFEVYEEEKNIKEIEEEEGLEVEVKKGGKK